MVDESGAAFSECGQYRYALWRKWDKLKPMVMCIGLNPSTATKDKPDPTITRVIGLTKSAGYGGFYMMNLFAYITPYPKKLKEAADVLGNNNQWLSDVSAICRDTIFCWGGFEIVSLSGKFNDRVQLMVQMFPNALCFGYTSQHQPRHPLMLKKDTPLQKYIHYASR